MVVRVETLHYFDSNEPVVQTDASTAGIGAALMQNGKPVAYASRSLTELECLAIVYGTAKFEPLHIWSPGCYNSY